MSGHDYASNEEVNRKERFYYVTNKRKVHFLGKQPDAALKEGEVVFGINGDSIRVVNSKGLGKDSRVVEKYKHLFKEN